MSIKIIQDFIPKGRKNRPGYPMTPKYITIHETGSFGKGANAKAHAEYIKSDDAANRPASWHFTVDDTEIYQHLPLNENGWHAGDGGSGTGNRQSIGIEICVNSDGNFEKAVQNAQWLVRKLMAEFNIPIENIKQHYDWSGKNCPYTIRKTPNGWKNFLDGLKDKPKEDNTSKVLYRVQTGAFKVKSNADKLAAELKKKGFDTYIVQADGLFKVQVGAYTVKANAEKMLKELQKAGFKGFITETNTGKPKEMEKPLTKPLSEYYEKFGLKVIETNPDNVYVATLPGVTLRQFGIYGINGTWQNTAEAHLSRSIWGLVANKNGAIGANSYQNSPYGYKRGTIIYYQDGEIEVKRINNISEITKPIYWAIGGGSLIPDIIEEENHAEDIFRYTNHTGIGYKGDRVFLIVTDGYCTMDEFRDRVLKLKLDAAIFLDGGGSTQMNYVGGKGVDSSRKLSHGIFLKKV